MMTKEFIFAGKAVFTIHNNKEEHYTFQVTKKESYDGEDIFFLALLSGPDNGGDYTYMGILTSEGEVRITRASKFNNDSKPVKVAEWGVKMVMQGKELPEGYGINHAGRCGRCGRTLTRPEGIDPEGYRFGFGPECWKMAQ